MALGLTFFAYVLTRINTRAGVPTNWPIMTVLLMLLGGASAMAFYNTLAASVFWRDLLSVLALQVVTVLVRILEVWLKRSCRTRARPNRTTPSRASRIG